jgi:midasin (ATPase involved in ribosome maturation)
MANSVERTSGISSSLEKGISSGNLIADDDFEKFYNQTLAVWVTEHKATSDLREIDRLRFISESAKAMGLELSSDRASTIVKRVFENPVELEMQLLSLVEDGLRLDDTFPDGNLQEAMLDYMYDNPEGVVL